MELIVSRCEVMECKFRDVKQGECFNLDGEIFVRVIDKGGERNALNINTSELWVIDKNRSVRRVRRAVLTIYE